MTGAGGFIGHHLTNYLVDRGYWVRGVDIKTPEFESTRADEFLLLDLTVPENCLRATHEMDEVYGLAANMGGIGFIENNKAVIVRDNTLINLNTIEAARLSGVKRYLHVERVHLSIAPAKWNRRRAVEGNGRVSRRCRGWLRLGKALHGARLPSLHGRLWSRYARRQIS